MAKWKASLGVLALKLFIVDIKWGFNNFKMIVSILLVLPSCPALFIFRNGPFSRCFGKWSSMTPDEVREEVLEDLLPLAQQKGVKQLRQKLANGSSGESMVLINACKCIHVVKNWVFVARSCLAVWIKNKYKQKHWTSNACKI